MENAGGSHQLLDYGADADTSGGTYFDQKNSLMIEMKCNSRIIEVDYNLSYDDFFLEC